MKSLNNLGKCSHSLLTRPQWRTQVNNQTITVSYSKPLYQFDVFIEGYPFHKHQHYSSIQPCYIANLILRITFGNAQVCQITTIWMNWMKDLPHIRNQLPTKVHSNQLLFSITLSMSDQTQLKSSNIFVTSITLHLLLLLLFLPHAKSQLHNSTQSWDKANSLFLITFGVSRHTWPHLLEANN